MSRSTTMLMALAPAGGQCAAGQRGHHEPDRRQAALGHHHRRQGGDQQQLDDAGLGQRHVGAHLGPGPGHGPWPAGSGTAGARVGIVRAQRTVQALAPGPSGRCRYAWPVVSRRRTPSISPSLSHRLNVVALVLVALIVVTGGGGPADRVGPGLRDWPECSVGHLTPALQFHGLVEFGNRLVTVVLMIAVAAAFLGASSARRAGATWSG